MRRASISLAIVGLAAISPAIASAAPTVTVKAKAVPIPGFPGTGNFLGRGADEQAEVTIKGTEYGGFPPPLIGANIYLPAGTRIHAQGFATCTEAVLKNRGSAGCPARSLASTQGEALGVVSFGNERVEERTSIKVFYAPEGRFLIYNLGTTPTFFEFVAPGYRTNGGAPYGPEFVATIPLIETLPGAPDASTLAFKTTVGGAYRVGRKVIPYGTMPRTCPKGGFPVKVELLFAGLGSLAPQTVASSYRSPCPRR